DQWCTDRRQGKRELYGDDTLFYSYKNKSYPSLALELRGLSPDSWALNLTVYWPNANADHSGTGSADHRSIGQKDKIQSGLIGQSPRQSNDLSHCIFECLIVEASSRAQNHLGVLADRYTQRCCGVFDCTGD